MQIGFIGCGNMAGAMIRGILAAGLFDAAHITASALSDATRRKIKDELGISCADNRETAGKSDILVLAVKPQFYSEVIKELKNDLKSSAIIVSIAPGKSLQWLLEQFGAPRKIIRAMPNTPAIVGEGMAGLCANEYVKPQELQSILQIFEAFGRAEVVSEHLMDVVTSVSGSSPAYIFLIIEAMADGAVADGMPRDKAYRFAAQAVLGSAKMVLETGLHPGALKDMVCSPGGTTMEAVRILEEKGLRSALIEAEKACVRKARGM